MDLPDADFSSKKRRRASGEIRGGEGQIRITTLEGNITFRESD
jgi:hypothetical protein